MNGLRLVLSGLFVLLLCAVVPLAAEPAKDPGGDGGYHTEFWTDPDGVCRPHTVPNRRTGTDATKGDGSGGGSSSDSGSGSVGGSGSGSRPAGPMDDVIFGGNQTVDGTRLPSWLEWQATGVQAKTGDKLRIKVVGRVSVHFAQHSCGPDGFEGLEMAAGKPGHPPIPLAGVPYGRVIGRVGPSGDAFSVGSGGLFEATTDGELFLVVNDLFDGATTRGGACTFCGCRGGHICNNEGEFAYRVEVNPTQPDPVDTGKPTDPGQQTPDDNQGTGEAVLNQKSAGAMFIWDASGPLVKVYISPGFAPRNCIANYHTRPQGGYFPLPTNNKTGGPSFHDIMDRSNSNKDNVFTLTHSGAWFATQGKIIQVGCHSPQLPRGYMYFWKVADPAKSCVSKAGKAMWDAGKSDGIIGLKGRDH